MSVATEGLTEGAVMARVGQRDLRQEGASLGFRLTLPAQILVLFIAVFPLLMQLYISLTDWTPLDGAGWWTAWTGRAGIRFANYSDLVTDARSGARSGAPPSSCLSASQSSFCWDWRLQLVRRRFPG